MTIIEGIHKLWGESRQLRNRVGDILANKKVKLAIQVVWILLIAIFIFSYIRQNWMEYRNYQWDIHVLWLVVSVLFALVRRLIGGLRWVFIVMGDDKKWSLGETIIHLRTYFLSNMAMYIPGSLWYMVGRVQLGKESGVSVKRSSFGLLYETLLLLLSGVTVGLYSAFFAFPQYFPYIILIFTIVIVAWYIVLSPRCVNYFLVLISNLTKNRIPKSAVMYRWGGLQLVLAIFLWVTGGLSQFFLIKAFLPEYAIQMLAYTISTSALSWTIGFLAPWAPSGLGVREGILVWLFSKFLPIQVCFVTSVVSRLVTVFEDIAWFIISMMFFKKANVKSEI